MSFYYRSVTATVRCEHHAFAFYVSILVGRALTGKQRISVHIASRLQNLKKNVGLLEQDIRCVSRARFILSSNICIYLEGRRHLQNPRSRLYHFSKSIYINTSDFRTLIFLIPCLSLSFDDISRARALSDTRFYYGVRFFANHRPIVAKMFRKRWTTATRIYSSLSTLLIVSRTVSSRLGPHDAKNS